MQSNSSPLLKSTTAQFDSVPRLALRLDISKTLQSPDLSPRAPKSNNPDNLPFGSSLRKFCKELDEEAKKSEHAHHRQTLDYFQTLAILPRILKSENKDVQQEKEHF